MALPNIIDSARVFIEQAGDKLARGTRKLLDPHNVESQIKNSDLLHPDERADADSWIDKKLITLSNERFTESFNGRWAYHQQFFSGGADFLDAAGLVYDAKTDGMVAADGAQKHKEQYFYKKHHPVTRPTIERASARITSAYPEAFAAPQTDSDEDKLAAHVAGACWANDQRENRFPALLEYVVQAFLATMNVFMECGWDANAYAEIGVPQADGSIKYSRERVGAFRMAPLLAIDCYPDPNAAFSRGRSIHDGAYFIKEQFMTVDHIMETWGVRIDATDSTEGMYGMLDQRFRFLSGDFSREVSKNKNGAKVRTVYEKPSPQFVKGRLWVHSGDKMLHKGWWPSKKNDRYPFVDFHYKDNTGSIWALNMASGLHDVQVEVNRAFSSLAGMMEWWVPMLFVGKSAGIPPTALSLRTTARSCRGMIAAAETVSRSGSTRRT